MSECVSGKISAPCEEGVNSITPLRICRSFSLAAARSSCSFTAKGQQTTKETHRESGQSTEDGDGAQKTGIGGVPRAL